MKTIRKALALFLALMMLASVFPVSAFAEETVASGDCGESLTWVLDDTGTLTISGTGAMEDYDWGDAPWFDYREQITTVVIEDGVTSIGDYAFNNCSALTGVVIPDSITFIGFSAFNWCTSLTAVTIPSGVTTIGNYAFNQCTSLTSVTISEGVTAISEGAFQGCSSLTSVTIPASVTTIGDWAFSWCNSLTSIQVAEDNPNYSSDSYGVLLNKEKTELICCPGGYVGSYEIPDSVISIGEYAFYYCTSLTSITIPDSVTSIGDRAFSDCGALTSVTIPASVTTIGEQAFFGCDALTTIQVVEDNLNYSSDSYGVLFNKEKTTLICCPSDYVGSYEIPDSVTTIGDYAFYGCTSLTSITIPDSVTTIGDSAFRNCTALTSITIPDSVTTIGDGAFEDCDALTSITIEDGVTSIGEYAFYGCISLTSVVIPDSVTTIGGFAFDYCTSLTSVTIPASVISIGYYAFRDCDALTDIYYAGTEEQWNSISISWGNEPLQNATIHYNFDADGIVALGRCGESLTWVLDDTGILTISGEGDMGDYDWDNTPWYGCRERITTVVIEDDVTSIGSSAFRGCTSLTSVTIPDSVTTIGNYAFGWCDSLTSVTIPNSVTTIGDAAFCYCKALTGIQVAEDNPSFSSDSYGVLFNKEKTTLICCPGGYAGGYEIPDSVTSIGWRAFYGCIALTDVTIPGSVSSTGYYSFEDCTALTSVTIPDSVTTIGDGAFEGCSALTSVTIPGGVTSIGYWAFSNCDALASITIPDSVTTIGGYAFCGCTALAEITIPDSVTSIASHAFTDTAYYNDESNWEDGLLYVGAWLLEAKSDITVAVIRAGTRVIAEDAFYRRTALTGVTIPDSVITIGDWAFGDCYALTSITIPDSVTTIGDYAFFYCTSLTSVTIPDSVTTIGYWAFYGCDALTDVYYGGTEEQWNAISVDEGNEYLQNATIHYGKTIDPPVLSIGNVDKTGAIKLSWEAVNGAAKYYIYRSTDGGKTYKYYDSTTKTTYTNAKVTPGTKYYYKVKSVSATGEKSAYSNVVSRTADCAKPSLSSSNVAGSGAIQLTWDSVTGATKYYIYRSTDGETYEYYASTTKTTYTNANVTPGTRYYYKIKAICANTAGNSAYSNVVSRTADCAKPSLSSSIVSSSGAIKLSWEAVNGAVKYYIYRSTDGETYEYYSSTTKTTYTNANVTPGTKYYYKIKAICSNTAGNSAYSNVVSRTADCAKPSLSSSNVASSGAIKLSWEAVNGAAKYYIYRSTDGETYKYYGSTTKTTYTDANVTPGTKYYYKIKAICSNTEGNSAYSNVVSRTADCAKPSLSSSNVAGSGAIKLSWEAVNGAAKYYIYRSTDGETYKYYGSTTKTTYTDANVTPGTKYYYKIKAICANTAGNSAYSNVVSRTADCAKPSLSSSSVASSGAIKLSWEAVNGAAKYYIYRSTDGETYSYYASTTKTTYTDANVTPGTRYYYKIKAICANTAGNSAYSNVVYRTADCAKPVVTIQLNGGKPQLKWSAIDGAKEYVVYRATSKSGTYTKMYTTTKLSYTNTSAVSGTTYYYKVMAICAESSYGNSAYSNVVSIKSE